ncbi:hypothetical protein GLP40_32665 [Nocardia sp. CT2-14]|uniref:Cysteine-rich domain-containing protein n=1 Tax=Nocardia aurantiaca TaxID=2675850 RepID=A0A6I3LAL8_9NOCA|nr:hypothetical protein [Nocardia aurantiaca]
MKAANTADRHDGVYEVVHHTQLLNRLVRQRKLIPVASVTRSVTYHDPCYLGRHNKIYNAPRELMAAAGSALVEMPRHGERSMCCGAGGARMWMEEQLGKRINIDRVDEGLATLSGVNGSTPGKIATGCPFCRVMLSDGVTARQDGLDVNDRAEVVDIAQLMLDAVARVEPAILSENLKVVQTTEASAIEKAASDTEAVTATTEAVTESRIPAAALKPVGDLRMKGTAKPPSTKADPTVDARRAAAPAKGLAMKGVAKKPGAKPSAPSNPAPTEESAASAATPAHTTVEKPVAKPNGLAMRGLAKAPGKRS